MTMNEVKVFDVGTPPGNFDEWETIEVRIHGFANLPSTSLEDSVQSDFSCLGYQWGLKLFPRADSTGFTTFQMGQMGNITSADITIEFSISIKDSRGKEVVHHHEESKSFSRAVTLENIYEGYACINFAKRSVMLDALVGGSLIIEVRMRLLEPSPPKLLAPFVPENPFQKNIIKLFNDEDSSDITFKVVGDEICDGDKKMPASTSFYAHKFILQHCAPVLDEMCGSGDVPITGIKPDIFCHLLYYIYGGITTDDDLKENAKDIIDAADKYGVVGLKLKAEAWYVQSTTITLDNMMDNLYYADAKNCALLKEAVIEFVVENGQDVLNKVQLSDVPGGTFADLLTAVTRREMQSNTSDGDNEQLSTMRVSELRKKLDQNGFDVDGSREAMIALLKANS